MLIVGHRGARGLAPENTLASIKQAVVSGANMVEIDVRVTEDLICVLYHNSKIGGKAVHKLRYDEAKSAAPDIALLNDAVELISRKIPLMIEIKPGVDIRPVVKILKDSLAAGYETSDFLIGSKSQKLLRAVKEYLPEIDLVVIERWSGVKARFRAHQLNTKFISMNQLWLWGGFISAINHSGFKLFAYTINDPEKAAKWETRGLYGTITDYPDRFVK